MSKYIPAIAVFFLLFISHNIAAMPKNMVFINGGTFWMGTDQHGWNERPAHQVTVDSFWIDKIPVTNNDFAQFVKETGFKTFSEKQPTREDFPDAKDELLVPGSIVFKKPEGEVDMRNHYNWWEYKKGANWKYPEGPDSNFKGRAKHPVVHVTFDDALAYCEWKDKTIATEAQWEYAARGGLDKKTYTWGDQPEHLKEKAKLANIWQGNFPYENAEEDGFYGTSPIGSFLPNGYGLYDMAGNVWEWVSDWYHPEYFLVSPKENPTGVNKEDSFDPNEPGIAKKIIKGGSFLCADNYCTGYRPSARMATDPKSGTNHLGFRCVKNK